MPRGRRRDGPCLDRRGLPGQRRRPGGPRLSRHEGQGCRRAAADGRGCLGVRRHDQVPLVGDAAAPGGGADHADLREVRRPRRGGRADPADRPAEAERDREQPGGHAQGEAGHPRLDARPAGESEGPLRPGDHEQGRPRPGADRVRRRAGRPVLSRGAGEGAGGPAQVLRRERAHGRHRRRRARARRRPCHDLDPADDDRPGDGPRGLHQRPARAGRAGAARDAGRDRRRRAGRSWRSPG